MSRIELDRPPTDEEKKWWRRMKYLFKSMPRTAELIVGPYGELSLSEKGMSDRIFTQDGHMDNIPTFCQLGTFQTRGRVIPNAERI